MQKRILALLLALVCLFQLMPVQVLGEGLSFDATWTPAGTNGTENSSKPELYTLTFTSRDGEEIYYAYAGISMDVLPEAGKTDRDAFLGWYLDGKRVTAPFTPQGSVTLTAEYASPMPASLASKKQRAGFVYENSGKYADISFFGSHKKNQVPSASPSGIAGDSTHVVLEAWSVSNLKNNTALTADAVITGMPELKAGETLAVYSVKNGALDTLKQDNLKIGDRVNFDLSFKGANGLAVVKVIDPQAAEETIEEIEGALYANEDIYLTGKIPGNGIIDVQPVTVSIDGEEVVAAWDIHIYANSNQQKKGKTWQPAGKKVQVHFRDDAFTGELNIYHLSDSVAEPEYVTTVEASDGWVEFEAESFSTYAVTRTIEKTVTIGGSTYRITVTFDKSAGIPEGAGLDVKEVSGDDYIRPFSDTLGLNEGDEVFYSKFLDISIVHNGEEIEPAAPVEVKVELLDVEDGAEALEVVHFTGKGNEKVNSEASAEGVVTFETDSFSVFGFGSVLSSLLSWTSDAVSYTLQGFSRLLSPTYTAIQVALEEGLEAVSAYRVQSTLGQLLNAMYVKVSTALNLVDRESVVVYSVKDGEIGEVLFEGDNVDASLSLGDADGFAVVRDTGYRRKIFDLGNVALNGMMPKAAEAEAEDVAEDYATFADEGAVVAAYDISIAENGEAYQPDETHPVDVSIAVGEVSENIEIIHIRDDGTRETVTDYLIGDGKVVFQASGFSVYVVIDHEGGNVITPRVEFHFIDRFTDAQYKTGIESGTPATPYNYVNNAGDYQTTQILKNGETLQLITDPSNVRYEENGVPMEKYFYGWYVVPVTSDSTVFDIESGKYTGDIIFVWPTEPDQIVFEQPVSIMATDINGDSVITADDTITWTLNGVTGTGTLDENGTAHVYLAPLYEDFFFINFHKGPKEDGTGISNSLMTRKLVIFGSGDTANVRIGDVICDSPDPTHKIFSGWETVQEDNSTKDYYQTVRHVEDATGSLINEEVDSSEGSNGYFVTVTKLSSHVSVLDLYPVFDEARWLYFKRGLTGNGSTYVSASYRLTNDERTVDASYYYFDEAFFKGTSTTQNHLSRRSGYNFGGWYLFANMDDSTENATGDITNLTMPGEVAFKYLDSTGSVQNTSINTSAIQVVDSYGNIQDIGIWYVDENGVISQNQESGSKLFEADGNYLRFYKAMDDMTLYARWIPIDEAEYTVIIWRESMTDTYAGNAVTNNRKFNFVQSYTFVGQSNTVATAVSRSAYSRVTDALGTYANAVIRGTKTDGTTVNETLEYTGFYFGSCDENVTIVPEGTTIVNVYYYRNTVTYQFRTYGNGKTGYTRTQSDSETPQQYAYINGEYVPLVRRPVEQWVWTAPTYVPTTSNTELVEYGIYNGEYVQLDAEEITTISYKWQYTDIYDTYDFPSNWTNNIFYLDTNFHASEYTSDNPPTDGDTTVYYCYDNASGWCVLKREPNGTTTRNLYTLNGDTYNGIRFLLNGTGAYTGAVLTRSGDSAPYTYSLVNGSEANSNSPAKYGEDTYGGHVALNGNQELNYLWAVPEYGDVYTASEEYQELMYGEIDGEMVELTPVKGTTSITTDVYKFTSTLTPGKEYLIVSTNLAGDGYALGHSGASVKSDDVTVNYGSPNYINASDVEPASVWTVGNDNTFKNGNYYIRYNNKTLQISTSNTSWEWNSTRNRLSYSNYYIVYNNGFKVTSEKKSVYLYQKDTVTEEVISITGYTYNGVTYEGERFIKSIGPTGNYSPYTGTRWVQTTMGNGWNLYRDEIGLYGEKLNWPTDNSLWWYESQSGTSGSGTRMTYKDAFLPLDTDMTVEYWAGNAKGSAEIRFYTQNIDDLNEYTLEETIRSNAGSFSINDKFSGFHAVKYRVNDTGNWQNVGTYNSSTGIYGSAVSYSSLLEVRFDRNVNDLIYFANYPTGQNLMFNGVAEDDANVVKSDDEVRVENIYYEADISSYAHYYDIAANSPTDVLLIAPDHYIFEGWYKDDAGTVEFDFSEPMPDGNVIVYAKWSPERFVVKIDPNGGEIDRIVHSGYTGFGAGFEQMTAGYMTFDAYAGEKAINSTGQSTYVRAKYRDVITEYEIPRRFVSMSDTAAASYTGTVYYYLNYQQRATDGASGIYTDLRSAVYLTEEEITHYYNLYTAVIDYSLRVNPDANTGMTKLDFATWKSLYVSSAKYRPLNSNEHWTFLGWYKTSDSTGIEESMPYNFADPVTEPFTLTAHWRLDGGYIIQYVPEYTMSDGAVINSTMTGWRDPVEETLSYADGAETEIYKAPTGLTRSVGDNEPEVITDDSVIFRGWALVNPEYDEDGIIIGYIPAEVDSATKAITTYYYPSDAYRVNAANANNDSKIYFQAIYQYRDASDRRPQVASLTLDANTGYINAGYSGYSPNLPVWDAYPGVSAVNTVSYIDDRGRPTQIEFGDIQASAAVHLYRYATDTGAISAGSDGYNYFTHPDGYFLLGFDVVRDPLAIVSLDPQTGLSTGSPQPYVPNYAADSVIAVTRDDAKTLYAVWEPMVYITFRNETSGTVNFGLGSKDGSALSVINIKNGLYDRESLNNCNSITLKSPEDPTFQAGEDIITLAIPRGAEKDITVSGTNTLGVGKVLVWNTSLDLVNGSETKSYTTAGESRVDSYSHGNHVHDLAYGEALNTKAFDFDETLIVNKNPLLVTFTERHNDYALLLDDNYPGGGVQEIDYALAEIQPDPETNVPKTQKLPTTSTRIGYSFIGWAYDKNATTPDFSSSMPSGSPWTIPDLNKDNGFFRNDKVEEIDGVLTRTLYAVWEASTDAVYVYKEVPLPGNQEQAFEFTVTITGTYRANSTNYTINEGTNQNSVRATSKTFMLAHGEYMRIKTTKDVGTENATAFVQAQVQVFKPVTDPDTNTTSYVENMERSGIIRWERSVTPSSNNGFNSDLKVVVTETSETYYNTEISLSSEKNDREFNVGGTTYKKSELPMTITASSFFWTNTDAGGSVVFINTRETYDVTVKKVYHGNSDQAKSFDFTASYSDDGVTSPLPGFTVISGLEYIMEDIPAGALLTVTESADEKDIYTTRYTADDMTYTDGKQTTFEVTEDTTVTFDNTLKSYPVTFKLVDQDGNPLHAMFSLSASAGMHMNDLYAGEGGVFYTAPSHHFWADTYTLNQTTTPDGYISLQGTPVTVDVTGNGIESSHSWVTVEGNTTDGFTVIVKNWEQKTVSVKKVLNDLLLNSTYEFNFRYSYISPVDGNTVNRTFRLAPRANNTAGASFDLIIPVNATNLTITELTTGDYAEIARIYDTTVASNGLTDSDTEDGPVFTVAKVDNDGSAMFINTRKMVEVKIKKIVDDPLLNNEGTYTFTATAKNGASVLTAYSTHGFISGVCNDIHLANNDEITLTVPLGSTIELEETGVSGEIYDTTFNADNNVTIGTSRIVTAPTVAGETKNVIVRNTRKTAEVTVAKMVVNGTSVDNSKEFAFKAVLYKADGTTPFTYGLFTNGANGNEQSFTLKHNGIDKTLTVPVGSVVKITEILGTDAEKYITSAEGTTTDGSYSNLAYINDGISASGDTIVFTNTRKWANVNITKIMIDPLLNTNEFTLQGTLMDEDTDITSGMKNIVQNNLQGNKELSSFIITADQLVAGEKHQYIGTERFYLPVGAMLTMSETKHDAYNTTVSNGSLKVSEAETSNTVIFTNTRKTVDVTVSKALVDNEVSGSVPFLFNATLEYGANKITDYTLNNTNSVLTDTKGQASFTLLSSNNESGNLTLSVPYGAKLTVSEDTGQTVDVAKTIADVYETSYVLNDETAVTGSNHVFESVTEDQRIAFTNTRSMPKLTVIKTVTGSFGDKNKDFTFTVTVQDMSDTDSYKYTKYQTNDDGATWTELSGQNGTLNQTFSYFSLAHNQKVEIEGLPNGKSITVVEANESYTTTWRASEGATIGTANGVSATVTLQQDGILSVTNNLEAVAPTDITLPTVPYVMMLASGLALVLLAILGVKRKKHENG